MRICRNVMERRKGKCEKLQLKYWKLRKCKRVKMEWIEFFHILYTSTMICQQNALAIVKTMGMRSATVKKIILWINHEHIYSILAMGNATRKLPYLLASAEIALHTSKPIHIRELQK